MVHFLELKLHKHWKQDPHRKGMRKSTGREEFWLRMATEHFEISCSDSTGSNKGSSDNSDNSGNRDSNSESDDDGCGDNMVWGSMGSSKGNNTVLLVSSSAPRLLLHPELDTSSLYNRDKIYVQLPGLILPTEMTYISLHFITKHG